MNHAQREPATGFFNSLLDRASGRDETTAPSTQMLRYLRRIDDLTGGALRWGILTNGTRWRLYWAGARSISEEFLEIDLGRVLALGDDEPRRHPLHLFDLRRAAKGDSYLAGWAIWRPGMAAMSRSRAAIQAIIRSAFSRSARRPRRLTIFWRPNNFGKPSCKAAKWG